MYFFKQGNVDKNSFTTPKKPPPTNSNKKPSSADKRLNILNGDKENQNVNSNVERAPKVLSTFTIQKDKLDEMVKFMHCPHCKRKLTMNLKQWGAMHASLNIMCKSCKETVVSQKSDIFIIQEGRKKRKYNKKLIGPVLASMMNGLGHDGLVEILTNIGFKYISKRTYQRYKKMIIENTKNVTEEHLKDVSDKILEYYASMGRFPDQESGILNIDVIYDGAWKTRGHDSDLGCGVVIDANTGFILDFQVFSKNCHTCSSYNARLRKGELEEDRYEEWLTEHKPHCHKNFDQSSGAMELEGAKLMWKRSIEKYKMRYTVFIGDGDTNTYDGLCQSKPYDDIKIEKIECINHVNKRMGTDLRNLVQVKVLVEELMENDNKKASKHKNKTKSNPTNDMKTVALSMGGVDGLNPRNIQALTKYYARAIKKYDTVEEMQNEIWATFYHVTSTDNKEKHDLCPPGRGSWCFMKQYEYDIQQERKELKKEWMEKSKRPMLMPTLNRNRIDFKYKTKKPSHDGMNVRLRFVENSPQYNKLKEVYKKNTCPILLGKCTSHKTQNPNESFHSKIWRLCPKTAYFGYDTLVYSICQNILWHHLGKDQGNMLKHFGIEPTQDMKTLWGMQESARVVSIPSKPRRKRIIFKQKRSQSMRDQQETYRSQGVYNPGTGSYIWPS